MISFQPSFVSFHTYYYTDGSELLGRAAVKFNAIAALNRKLAVSSLFDVSLLNA
jgi:hypothetical protein